MQNMKYICVCVYFIIITIVNVISMTICVTNCVYSNTPKLTFMEISLAQVKCAMYCPESVIQLCPCNFKKVFNMGFTVPRSPSQF
jgi:hypothetical protein